MVDKKIRVSVTSLGVLTSLCLIFFALDVTQTTAQSANGDYVIYAESLSEGWQNWSWSTTIDFSDTQVVKTGSHALSAQYDAGWAGIFLHIDEPVATSNYATLDFWLHGGSGAQPLKIILLDEAGNGGSEIEISAQPNTWQAISIPFEQLAAPSLISGLFITEHSGNAQQKLYLDDIRLAVRDPNLPTPTPVPPQSVTVTIDTSQVAYEISEHIYGLNFADEALSAELDLPLNRWGGNAVTRYNYKLDVSNRGSDWFFENISTENINVASLPVGSSADNFIATNQQNGTDTLMTMPMIGWTPRARDNSCAYSVSKYGAQQATDPWRPDCGNGATESGETLNVNNPTDTSIAINENYVTEWIGHLTSEFGNSAEGGVGFYSLDNEPMLWNHTHRDVHPDPVSYDELRDRSYTYGAAVKNADPSAQTLGPVLWGWTAYEFSAADAASGNWDNPPDRLAHGNLPLAEWYLKEMAAYEAANGTRILDYFDLHYYPQNSGVPLTSVGGKATEAERLRSTRSLWDPNYVDETWIAEPVQLIPRMQTWVDRQYPNTKLSLSEYNWGGLEHINGALAQADVLGIFGREGLDMAMLWDPPAATQPGAFALRMYRNYDGLGSKFGSNGYRTVSSDSDKLAVYAATRSTDNVTTVIVINKAMTPVEGSFNITGQAFAAQIDRYTYSSANLNAIVHTQHTTTGDVSAELSQLYPADSITLFELRPIKVKFAHQVVLPLVVR